MPVQWGNHQWCRQDPVIHRKGHPSWLTHLSLGQSSPQPPFHMGLPLNRNSPFIPLSLAQEHKILEDAGCLGPFCVPSIIPDSASKSMCRYLLNEYVTMLKFLRRFGVIFKYICDLLRGPCFLCCLPFSPILFFFVFQGRISCSPGWPQTCYIVKAGLEFLILFAGMIDVFQHAQLSCLSFFIFIFNYGRYVHLSEDVLRVQNRAS